MPELPRAKRQRYLTQLRLAVKETDILLSEPAVAEYFDATVALGADPKRVAALLLNNLAKRANEKGCRASDLGLSPAQLKQIVDLLAQGQIGSSNIDKLIDACLATNDAAVSVADLAQRAGLIQVSDAGAIQKYVDQVLADACNAKAVADVKSGKVAAIGALVGQVMKLSKGQANPKMVTELLQQKLRG